jgi:hypothetical protein
LGEAVRYAVPYICGVEERECTCKVAVALGAYEEWLKEQD